jgi:hypothetical protein
MYGIMTPPVCQNWKNKDKKWKELESVSVYLLSDYDLGLVQLGAALYARASL